MQTFRAFTFNAADRSFYVLILESDWTRFQGQMTWHLCRQHVPGCPTKPMSSTGWSSPVAALHWSVVKTFEVAGCMDPVCQRRTQKVNVGCREFVERYEVDMSFDNKQQKVKLEPEFLPANRLAKNESKLTLTAAGGYHEVVTLQFSCSLVPNQCRFQIHSKTGRITATLAKQNDLFNRGPSALPLRYIENEELQPFVSNLAIKEFLEASNLIKMMLMTPEGIDLLLQPRQSLSSTTIKDTFGCLQETVAGLWRFAYDHPEVRTFVYKYFEDEFNERPFLSKFDILLRGCYLFRGMPFLRVTFIDVCKALEFIDGPSTEAVVLAKRREVALYDRATGKPHCQACTITEEEHRLTWRLMFSNSLRIRQESSSRSANDWHWETYLPLLFRRGQYPSQSTSPFDWKTALSSLENLLSAGQPLEKVCAACDSKISAHQAVKCRQLCDSVIYCSKTCQDADWSRHKTSCRPPVTTDESEGASKSAVPAGDACASCGKVSPDLKKCARCSKVLYCSKACQQAHWSVHKIICQPASTTEYQARDQKAQKTCASCGKASETLKKCTICSNVLYCGRACQKADWLTHKLICQDTATAEDNLTKANEVCASCGKVPGSLKKCTRCRKASYCDRRCQEADWPKHKVACRS